MNQNNIILLKIANIPISLCLFVNLTVYTL